MQSAATETANAVQQVGVAAGKVWEYLSDHGQVRMADLVRGVDESRDTVQRAVGWLAREDKISIEKAGNSERVRLR